MVIRPNCDRCRPVARSERPQSVPSTSAPCELRGVSQSVSLEEFFGALLPWALLSRRRRPVPRGSDSLRRGRPAPYGYLETGRAGPAAQHSNGSPHPATWQLRPWLCDDSSATSNSGGARLSGAGSSKNSVAISTLIAPLHLTIGTICASGKRAPGARGSGNRGHSCPHPPLRA